MVMLSTYERNFGRESTGGVYAYRKLPPYLEGRAVITVEEILPPEELETRFKRGELSVRGYIHEYLGHLMSVNAEAFWKKYSDKTLIGQAKPHNGKLDNRFIIAEWLRMHGYEVLELEKNT